MSVRAWRMSITAQGSVRRRGPLKRGVDSCIPSVVVQIETVKEFYCHDSHLSSNGCAASDWNMNRGILNCHMPFRLRTTAVFIGQVRWSGLGMRRNGSRVTGPTAGSEYCPSDGRSLQSALAEPLSHLTKPPAPADIKGLMAGSRPASLDSLYSECQVRRFHRRTYQGPICRRTYSR